MTRFIISKAYQINMDIRNNMNYKAVFKKKYKKNIKLKQITKPLKIYNVEI